MTYNIEVEKRELKGEKLRESGKLPGVVYGAGTKSVSISLDPSKFVKLYQEAGMASLIDMKLAGKDDGKILIQDIQRDPVTERPLHVDLKRIDMNKVLTAKVALVYVGIAPAVKEQGGILVKNIEEVEVKCLPKDLVSEFDVDLTQLVTVEDTIKVSDLKLPEGLEVVSPSATTPLATITVPMTDEEIKALEEKEADVSKVEVEGEEKAEGEEGEEKEGEKKEEDKKEDKK